MSGGVLGAVLVWTGLVWWVGFGVFALACRLSETGPRTCRDARRIAAWQRVGPYAPAFCSLLVAVGAVLLVVDSG